MFVTSDRHVVESGRRDELLVAGVAVTFVDNGNSPAWIQFVEKCARIAGIYDYLSHAGYDLRDGGKARQVKPKRLIELQNDVQYFNTISGLVLRAVVRHPWKERDIWYGGIIGRSWRNENIINASFTYPLNEHCSSVAFEMLLLASTLLDATNGYSYIRDLEYGPETYGIGFPGGDRAMRITNDSEISEIAGWQEYLAATDPRIWVMRDLYTENIVSDYVLNLPILGMPLKTAIMNGAIGGEISSNSMSSLWQIDSRDIPEIRILLGDAGVIWARHGRVYRDLKA